LSLAIVMPAYNESGCIERVVTSWLTVFDTVPGVLIVVNDGSRDDTGKILDALSPVHPRLKVVHQKNAGHGAAVMRGYQEALQTGEPYIFQTDSDDQFMPADFPKLWEMRERSPFVTGYRKDRHDAFARLVITRIVRVLNFLFFGCWLKDSNIPFRLMRADYLRELLSLIPPGIFTPNIMLAVLAAKSGAKLQEIPITHIERQTGTVSIVKWRLIKVCFRSAYELLRFRLSLLRHGSQLRGMRERYAAT
jgi:dolichol-phosphate mannosyltransferase